MTDKQRHTDLLIIGSGASGLTLALQLAESARVKVISKAEVREGATWYAQGGVSAVLDSSDSLDAHINDTINTGCGLCHEATVRFVVENGRASVNWLMDMGVNFTRLPDSDGQDFHLHQEGGHSRRRILHAADSTGKAIEDTLEARARAHRNIELMEFHTAVDLIVRAGRCAGAYVYDQQRERVMVMGAGCTVLATGGAGKVYLYTSNPDISTGDGIAMAWRAGCRIANMEFIQFHPTCLYHQQAKSFLISEALRGEGARLRLPDGAGFMERFDQRGELAPRDVVARAIDYEMKRLGSDCVYLDISHRGKRFVTEHFPAIYARCMEFGFDLGSQAVPVVPAAHYTCGGVVVDNKGQTDLPDLYAIGEVSCSGLHGANRMASNSLLECLVFAHAACKDIRNRLHERPTPPPLPEWDESRVTDSDEEIVVSHNWDELRRFMWDYVGIVRTNKRLQRAKRRISLLQDEIYEYYGHFRINNDLLELRNLSLVAELIVESALRRKESRGLHYNRDYPPTAAPPPGRDTILAPTQAAASAIAAWPASAPR